MVTPDEIHVKDEAKEINDGDHQGAKVIRSALHARRSREFLLSKGAKTSNSDLVVSPATVPIMSKTPADFLKAVIGHRVKVRLHSDTEYRGTLYIYTNIL